MIFLAFLVIVGFIALIFGANWLVEGASGLARRFGVSSLVIGLTVVAFGTSAPELVVSLFASVQGYSDIVLGNVIGSNNFNLFIILGVVGLIMPISVQSSTAWREIPVSIFISVLFFILATDFFLFEKAGLSRLDGAVLLLFFALFIIYIFRQLKKEPQVVEKQKTKKQNKIYLLIVLGLVGLIAGGQLVVINSIKIAEELNISEKIIGLTIVAAGTSLPELVTSFVAALKKNSDIAIGNIIGSNIFNVLLILGISSVISPLHYNIAFNTDIYVLMAGSLALFIFMLTGKRKRLDRWEAAILLTFYILYTVFLIL